MSEVNRRAKSPLWAVVYTLFIMLAAGSLTAFWQNVEAISTRRHSLREIAQSSCPQGDNKTCQSVHADVRAANAADDMVDLGIWQFIAGIVGIVFVGLTLKATREAVRESSRASQTASDALHEARRTADLAVADQRAWVSIKVVPKKIAWTATKHGIMFHYDVVFENLGRSLAHDFTFRIGYAFEGPLVNEQIADHQEKALSDREAGTQSLLPSERWLFPGLSGLTLDKVHWLSAGRGGKKTRMMPLVLVTAYYRTEADGKLRHTERFFSIIRKGDDTRFAGIDRDDLDLGADELAAWPRTETTSS